MALGKNCLDFLIYGEKLKRSFLFLPTKRPSERGLTRPVLSACVFLDYYGTADFSYMELYVSGLWSGAGLRPCLALQMYYTSCLLTTCISFFRIPP